ncbi:MAG TPA: tetratricopeptide repeat-containing glycosyltransferase family protein [Gemmatimonadaceae bacterium]|nr:tetratricopeptide repeat-containing glycosyltransferase family protein [Gemmatimonadaceae bacterium]
MNHIELAKRHRKEGRLAEAAAALRTAVMQDPMNPECWFQGGSLAIKLGDFAFAKQLFEMCVSVVTSDKEAAYNVGHCSFRLGDPIAAVRSYERALAIDPSFLRARIALGQMLYVVGRHEEASAAFDQALSLPPPASPVDQELRALVRVARGEFVDGWREFDNQWVAARAARSPWPIWDGAAAPDATVCLTVDGGFGDTILFARYARQIRARVRRLVAIVQPDLRRLLETLDGLDAVAGSIDDVAGDIVVSGFWTLPRKLRSTPETIPMTVPYLSPPGSGPVLPQTTKLRAGIAWFGGARCAHDFDRSCPDLSHLSALFTVPGVEWYDVQPRTARSAEGDRFGIHPLPPVQDFGDTAFVLRQMDLVISVDTAVSNLSAALGVPTWIMVPTIPEFRWPIGASRSPWYPSARLFRRANTWQWTEVGRAIASDLATRVETGVDPDLPEYRRWDLTA